MSEQPCCGPELGKPYCRWWCPVHFKHHVVANMVTHCVAMEKLTNPNARPDPSEPA